MIPYVKETYISKMADLTKMETEAVKQIYFSASGNGFDFGFTDEVNVSPKKGGNGGVISSLIKKEVIVWDEEKGQIAFFSWTDDRHKAAIDVGSYFGLDKVQDIPSITPQEPLSATIIDPISVPPTTPTDSSTSSSISIAKTKSNKSNMKTQTLADLKAQIEALTKIVQEKELVEQKYDSTLTIVTAAVKKEGWADFEAFVDAWTNKMKGASKKKAKKGHRLTDEQKKTLEADLRAGMKPNDAATKYGVTYGNIAQYKKKFGLVVKAKAE